MSARTIEWIGPQPRGNSESRLLVRRTLAERVIIEAVRQRLSAPENLHYVFERVVAEVPG